MSEHFSCSACCGIYNLKKKDEERYKWLEENTQQFLALDLSNTESIIRFRREREMVTLPQRVREDTYVCPFVGFVHNQKMGCLLHPVGSPHPQISILPHPQNFSFYGEGICQSYDCLAKERRAHRADFFRWAETAPFFAYSRLASDHTLHRALAGMDLGECDLAPFYDLLSQLYEEYNVVVTSFENIEKEVPSSWEDLWLYLANNIVCM
ncbi:MAG TPA: hypothetical protein PLY93_10365 [Turneriella sp.]|nr:hypothetical protein [Turneriella sp.]